MAGENESAEDSEDDEDAADAADGDAVDATPPQTVARPTLPSLSRFFMIFLGLLAVYTFIDPNIRAGFASVADTVLFPAIGFGGGAPTVTILLAGILTTTISSVIRDHYTNWLKTARTQKVLGALRREQMEAMRKGQASRLEKLKGVQVGMQKDQMEMMTTPYKSMAWTFLLFIVIFNWLALLVDVRLANLGNQWIAVPWSSHVYLNSVAVFPVWVLLYSLLAIPFGQIITRVLKYIRFRRRLEEMGIPLRAESGGTA